MDFYDRVRILVKKNNTTISSMLNSTFKGKISIDAYNGWKRRGLLPRADVAVKIARALGTTTEYLVDGDEGLSFSDTLNEIIKIYYSLSPERQEEILKICQAIKSVENSKKQAFVG